MMLTGCWKQILMLQQITLLLLSRRNVVGREGGGDALVEEQEKKRAKLIEGEDWLNTVEDGKLEVVRAFTEAGGRDLDEKDGGGYTALFNAADNGHLDVLKVLLQAGAGVDVATNYGTTPLHYAAVNGELEVCKYLVEDGKASINEANNHGNKNSKTQPTRRTLWSPPTSRARESHWLDECLPLKLNLASQSWPPRA